MGASRLLIVDDDPELRAFLCSELSAEGHRCEVAATGQEALVQVRQEPPDLVLLDWTLPDFSGVEVCQRMRASQIATPVLMLTARDDVSERVKALDAGAATCDAGTLGQALLADPGSGLSTGTSTVSVSGAPTPLQGISIERTITVDPSNSNLIRVSYATSTGSSLAVEQNATLATPAQGWCA